jgi:8-oxo-dGTP pyrophosphatase MutT (NUDIX family)
MRRAAVVVVPSGDGRVLAVSRPTPPWRYAFPGGTVEPGEGYEQAARRELLEETGLVADKLVRVHADRQGSTTVVAFMEVGRPVGDVRSSSEGWTRWVSPQVVTGRGAAWPEFAEAALRASSPWSRRRRDALRAAI